MAIGNLNLDLRVCPCSSCKNLVLEDHSYYLDTPESPRVNITTPGSSTPWTFEFTPNKSNIYNSYSFGSSLVADAECLGDLADGLYTIKYMICPYDELNKTIYHVRQCLSWCRWETLLRQFFTNCLDLSRDSQALLNRIEYLLKGAEAFAADCDPDKAMELHQKAVELLTRLECQVA